VSVQYFQYLLNVSIHYHVRYGRILYSAMVQLYVSDKCLLKFIIYPGIHMSFPDPTLIRTF
jgi:hypothetical protein